MKQIIHLTKNAIKHLVKLKNKNNCKYILFSAKGGGCNGFGYNIEPTDDEPQKLDEIVNIYDDKTNTDLSIQVCGRSVFYLLGTEIDWKEDFMGARFVFDNPQAKSKCGCGTSFSIK